MVLDVYRLQRGGQVEKGEAGHLIEMFVLGSGARELAPELSQLDAIFDASSNLLSELDASLESVSFELGRRAARHANGDISTWLDTLHPEDMILAIGCGLGDAAAMRKLDALYGPQLRSLLARYVTPRRTIEDLYQSLNERLFVHREGQGARILDYSGKGTLRGWLRVAGVRLAIDDLRSEKSRQKHEVLAIDEEQIFSASARDDLEVDFLKATYRGAFKQAVSTAIADLDAAERNLLRQHLIAGMSIDEIGALHGIHRATAARRLARVRGLLLESTRAALMRSLALEADEFESIMGLVISNLDVSFSRILRSRTRSGAES